MALQALVQEEIQYLELWENSPRLPKSVQAQLAGLSGKEKIRAAAPYFLIHQDVMVIARAMTALGFNPLEFLNSVGETIFDGNRRLMAANLLLDPTLATGVTKEKEDGSILDYEAILTEWHNDMDPELLETLKAIPVIKFHPGIYTLESATMELAKAQFARG